MGKEHFLLNQPARVQQLDLSLKYKSAIWHDEFEAFKSLKADVLVSHEAPGSHRHGFRVISELGVALGVKHIFHGHLHEDYATIIRNKIKVCGVANSAVTDLLGRRLI